ncbi:hypothetical protein N7462_006143 [Penicillium macrosclerotiorum]|uniref:uncharacterized protein n=1 Tax=Penicillium macrosclerotiorum TaxID=303699 RepID=UPI00254941D7|nr:uncharacterized protein N7462_006143 [Penicillium macrosclerotiorum]KAJ5682978.1 hypothetical protein N7462_006143 [Penicillium macrosclerotiorum]
MRSIYFMLAASVQSAWAIIPDTETSTDIQSATQARDSIVRDNYHHNFFNMFACCGNAKWIIMHEWSLFDTFEFTVFEHPGGVQHSFTIDLAGIFKSNSVRPNLFGVLYSIIIHGNSQLFTSCSAPEQLKKFNIFSAL